MDDIAPLNILNHKKKILFIGRRDDVFFQNYKRNLDPNRYDISVFSQFHGDFTNLSSGKTEFILKIRAKWPRALKYILRYPIGLIFLIRYTKRSFDVIHILNIKRENFFLIPFLKKHCKKLIVTVYGRSTYVYPSKKILFAQVYKYVDLFIFSNQGVLKEFSLANPEVPQHKLFEGTMPVGHISINCKALNEENILNFKNKYRIESDLIHISCSSTIASYDQHEKVIEALKKIKYKDKVQLMFLLTYGGTDKERQRIQDIINQNLGDFNVRVFTSFLTDEEVSAYRNLTDIYINMRSTDQLAGAMLESLFEGACLISGSWLNYETLDKIGIHYNKVDRFEELTATIDKSIDELPEFKMKFAPVNSKKIAAKFSVETVMQTWDTLYQSP